ncbi:MAG: transporter substrate-binding domain-containing protein [Deltaproteobacteria bacterium]|nr:transporter substrate-binding domain-containing protein [Deltaproteobacteria bacterium]MCB2186346.1 transporter substrate-binding domain-containing protein [Deltaproteobacteria bacterium]
MPKTAPRSRPRLRPLLCGWLACLGLGLGLVLLLAGSAPAADPALGPLLLKGLSPGPLPSPPATATPRPPVAATPAPASAPPAPTARAQPAARRPTVAPPVTPKKATPAPSRVPDQEAVYAYDPDFPPFTFSVKGQPAGFEWEVLKAALEGQRVRLKPVAMAWKEAVAGLDNGEANLTSALAKAQGREKAYVFCPHPLVSLQVMIFAARGAAFRCLADLEGKRVAVRSASIQQRLAQGQPLALVLTDNEEDSLRAVVEGRAEACLAALQTGLYFVHKNSWSNLTAVGSPLVVTQLFWAADSQHPWLMDRVADGLRKIRRTGAYAVIYRRWFAPELSEEEIKELFKSAERGRQLGYAPYSGRPGAAALLTGAGQFLPGATVENALDSLTASPLTTALLQAASQGLGEIKAVITLDALGQGVIPNPQELQILSELNPGAQVILGPPRGPLHRPLAMELLPYPFEAP